MLQSPELSKNRKSPLVDLWLLTRAWRAGTRELSRAAGDSLGGGLAQYPGGVFGAGTNHIQLGTADSLLPPLWSFGKQR